MNRPMPMDGPGDQSIAEYGSQPVAKITDYVEDLLKDLDRLQGWPERVRTMQAN